MDYQFPPAVLLAWYPDQNVMNYVYSKVRYCVIEPHTSKHINILTNFVYIIITRYYELRMTDLNL